MPLTSIVAIWLFDDGTGETVEDFSRNGHDGEILGDVNWTEGKFGTALEFPGIEDNHVSVSHKDSLNLGDFTITAWVKQEPAGFYPSVLGKGPDPDRTIGSNYFLQSDTEGHAVGGFTTEDVQWMEILGPTLVGDMKWHHEAVTWDHSLLRLYIDGVLDEKLEPLSQIQAINDLPLTIGSKSGVHQMIGVIDEVGLFNVALTEDDIKNIVNNGLEDLATVSSAGKLATAWGSIKVQY